MKKSSVRRVPARAAASQARSASRPRGRIHPVVIYPFRHPADLSHLDRLYRWIAELAAEPATYARPVTVVDRKTHHSMAGNAAYAGFRAETVGVHSEILDAWCVDTCQMWYSGLGQAYDRGDSDDVYWLIPGDFNYGSQVGQEVLSRLHDLPEILLDLDQDFCVGEITTDHNNPKQLIDTYGTFALLYTWFPREAQEIREYTERPRSEFFAIRHEFLGHILRQRWFAYEQTMVTLLHAVFQQKRISRFCVGQITDLHDGGETLASALQQVERTERVLKTLWRARHESDPGWIARYRDLERQSEIVRRTAQTLLQNLLT
ncbi:MAG: hypothetical protein JNL10_12365 [Verrucomicrobiales bacterium]|nr:hypothetical protein [Verrucomicrobiales bacterium]